MRNQVLGPRTSFPAVSWTRDGAIGWEKWAVPSLKTDPKYWGIPVATFGVAQNDVEGLATPKSVSMISK
jgi:hypothetical protein